MNGADELLGRALARGQADDPAILFGDETVTYGELDRRASRVAGALAGLGVVPDDRVVVLVHDRPQFFDVYLGAMKAGAVPVAINLRCSAKDLAYVIADSGCPVICLDAEFLDLFDEVRDGLARAPRVIVTNGPAPRDRPGHHALAELMAAAAPDFAPVQRGADAMAFWMYTSGTTGAPKGAVHALRALTVCDGYLRGELGLGRGDRLFCSSKLFFAFAIGHVLMAGLRMGATAVLYDDWPSAEAIAQVVERHRPTAMFSVPTFFRNLLREGLADRPCFRDVRHYVSAGEKLPEPLFEQWRAHTGHEILEVIGATEAAFPFLGNRPGRVRPGTCGTPMPGVKVELRDDDGQVVTATGVPGILWVKAASLALCYWGQDEKSRAVFRDGWYCTGDMFLRDAAGCYAHQGRGDDMLKISGQWVSPAEIEERVLTVPGVSEAVVVGARNADGLVRLALFVVAPDCRDPAALERQIMDTCKAGLSIYKCPRRIFVVDDLPRTPTGKVQRFALRDQVADGG
ncbi:MAG: benzoate-CoA ligase family protein [Hyphomicrobiales bacterium]|nr:benzoate-CoA ligase family protein [Hyphomicrobiales bacterium]MCP5371035.1 benzoate-CoA ligase family protein [Hyphomicrobiales bacterium]